jgi:hypothetical protein
MLYRKASNHPRKSRTEIVVTMVAIHEARSTSMDRRFTVRRRPGGDGFITMCWLEGTRPEGSTIYYPVHGPGNDLLNLPLRNDLSKFAKEICALRSERARKETGIKGLSFLLDLPLESVQYPFAIP